MNEARPEFARLAPDAVPGQRGRLNAFINLYGCIIGAGAVVLRDVPKSA